MYTQGWLLVGWMLIAIGLAARHGFAFLLGAVVLCSAGASYLWDRFCLARVEYRRSFTPRRAFYGETVTFTMEVTNRKILPLAWLEVIDELPVELELLRGRVIPSVRQRRQHLVNLFSVRWYERVRRHFTVRCAARGYFPLGPARVRSGDVFGFTVRGMDLEHTDYLLVYPKVVPLEALGLPALHPIGDLATRRPLLEDPTRIVGARGYQPTDPLRRIHWKATAKSGGLQSKLYEPTTSHRFAVFLNLDTLGRFAEYRGFVRALLELNILTAASITSWAIGQGHLVGLYANGYLPHGLRWIRIPPASGSAHLATMLEALAKVFPTPVMPVGDLMQLEAPGLPWGTTAVVVTAVTDAALRSGVARLLEAGHTPVLVLVGEEAEPIAEPVPTYRVRSDRGWRALEGLALRPAGVAP
ncbi:MAG: DUF58 domain-containing protein [Armatimonadota bacterium]|nr:DUF58 domain-containing protein [Armatimonadota bacterium]MDR7451047.1 DUF58 domain-containing protein [Armatimonadota bacterium]MDR7465932.1 DUF58 domain-containing protein [Armatimonadota bacterium]MDR7493997.1 DUF58 domain-containing protein [Armatimonadota bacterium]MDR7498447.1 DUF58 domain-containing protein [Armatimonadota bacterium]